MRTMILALTLSGLAALAACSDDTTTGSVDADPTADPNAVVVEPATPTDPVAPVDPNAPVQ